MIGSTKKHTRNVYAHILNFFKILKHLSIIQTRTHVSEYTDRLDWNLLESHSFIDYN
jgi:hypothetical protein